MSNPNPQSGLAPLRGLRKQTAPFYRGRLFGDRIIKAVGQIYSVSVPVSALITAAE